MKKALTVASLFVASVLLSPVQAKDYPLPDSNTRLIGENTHYVVPNDGRSLEMIASEYQIGLLAMLEANPGYGSLFTRSWQRVDYSDANVIASNTSDGDYY
ncbi:Probable L,D-transpeptidase YcfS precursor [Providencia stuartii]|nr:Probable L,D-transpeptidase YcfS precursor [Providencia stuartii]